MKNFFKRKLSSLFAISVLVVSSTLIVTAARELTEIQVHLLLHIVLISTSILLLSILAPTLYPKKISPETVFLGGAAKPPYAYSKEIYSPPTILGRRSKKERSHESNSFNA
ncbi:MAG: hypothetical protein QXG01_06440 [Candidatus Bathyarchaeia archaeon]